VAAAGVDSDHDGLLDSMEVRLGTNPLSVDSDGDGISDAYEVLVSHTNPNLADTDRDGTSDAVELLRGTDPTTADQDGDGRIDGGHDTSPDSDGDGLSDALERLLGTRTDSIDTDGDGVTDQLEYRYGLDPLHPGSGALTTDPSQAFPTTGPGTGSGLDHPPVPHWTSDWASDALPGS
jgi:hypothetical protein